MKKKILLVSGDPFSINSEIIFKCYNKLNKSIRNRVFLISNYELIKKQFKRLGYSIKLEKVKDLNVNVNNNKLKILDVKIKFKDSFKIPNNEVSNFILNSLDKAHYLASRNDVSGIVNCAINKNHLKIKKIGVTEYLASKCKIKNDSEVMLISNGKISVCPITTHIDIKDISKKISPKLIITKINTINGWFLKNYKRKPKICILGLNPHNAELRKNSEEIRLIIPAIKLLKKKNFNITGPMSADTIFIKDFKKYDVIVGMYHDQVLAPFKSIFKLNAINITLGLSYNRVSPDHGTAKDLIGKNLANETSLLKCINFINKS